MARILIIGASRGIGLGLVDVHLDDGWEVHATSRDGSMPRPDVATYAFDVRDRGQLKALVADLPGPMHRIIHNAGVLRAPRSELIEVNTVAPIRTIEALLEARLLVEDGTLAIMTSQMGARRGRTGSLGDYGDSKAELNDEFRRRVAEWREAGAIAVVIHPGWVQTDMGGPGASITVSESVSGIKQVMDELSADDHGRFLTWNGREHPW